jgi:MoxR-like ATPase
MIDPRAELAAFAANGAATTQSAFTLPKQALILLGQQCGARLGDYARKTLAEVAILVVGHAKQTAGPDWLQYLQEQAAACGRGAVPIVQADAEPAKPQFVPADAPKPQIDEHADKHPLFRKVLALVQARKPVNINIMTVGPAGCGKTTLFAQVAAHLGLPFGVLSMSAGVSESALSGWLLPTGENGKFEYHPAPFAEMIGKPCVFLFDEADAADPNLLLTANTATANRYINVPHRLEGARIEVHPEAILCMACNTFGTGADAQYVGRNQLDAATLDRFYILSMDYDRQYEAALAGLPIPPRTVWRAGEAASASVQQAYAQWVWALRDKVQALKLRRVVSTRTLQKGLAALSVGVPLAEVKADMLAGWSRDEIAKVSAEAPRPAARDHGERF